MIRGLQGFIAWVEKNHFDLDKEKIAFIKRVKETLGLKKHGVISAMKSILSEKNKLNLDNIFFSDFYNIDYFGKTKLGQLVYLGKTSQNRNLILEVSKIIKLDIEQIIAKYDIGFVCFIPPTIDRKLQFLDVLKKGLRLNIQEVVISKITSETRVPQKTLRRLDDRILNAKATIVVKPTQKIDKNVFIIDDATGSGATLNETAKKIKDIADKHVKVYGYSVVGSYKGFDVISEV